VPPSSALPIVIEPYRANGVYNDQAMLYATSAEGSIKAYHYQLWDEAPSTLLQRRLIAELRACAARRLSSRTACRPRCRRCASAARSNSSNACRAADGWVVRVRLELHVERDVQSAPLLLKTYAADVRRRQRHDPVQRARIRSTPSTSATTHSGPTCSRC
jgi:hypothetical protein